MESSDNFVRDRCLLLLPITFSLASLWFDDWLFYCKFTVYCSRWETRSCHFFSASLALLFYIILLTLTFFVLYDFSLYNRCWTIQTSKDRKLVIAKLIMMPELLYIYVWTRGQPSVSFYRIPGSDYYISFHNFLTQMDLMHHKNCWRKRCYCAKINNISRRYE